MMMTKRNILLASTARNVLVAAFDGSKAGWKMDGDKLALDASGNPIYVKEDGSEQTIQADTISRLNGEAKNHRERAERAETSLKKYEVNGKLIDPEQASKALETVGKLDAKQLIDAGEVDKVREEVAKGYTGQITERDNTIASLNDRVNAMTLDREFMHADFIDKNVAVPRDMFVNTFKDRFKVEDGKVVPYGPDGNKIYSKKNMGEVASVNEAFEILVEQYPHKDAILKAPDQRGSGNGGGGGNRGGGNTIKRSTFEGLSPQEKAAYGAKFQTGEVQLVD